MKNTQIKDNSDCSSLNVDVLESENVKKNNTKVILKQNEQESKDYFLYHSISKF